MLDQDSRHRRAQGLRAGLPPRGDGRRERHRRRPGRERRASTRSASARVLEAARRADAGRVILVEHGVGLRGDARRRRRRDDAVRPRRPTATSTCRARSRPRCSAPTTPTCSAARTPCLRYGIPFGPRMRSDLVVAAFLERALRGEPLRIDGDGSQERSFVYVEDLAAAHVLALAPVAENRTYNLEVERADLDPPARRDGRRPRRRRRGHVRAVPARRLPGPQRQQRAGARRARLGAALRLRGRARNDARLVPTSDDTPASSPTAPAPATAGAAPTHRRRPRVQRGADGRGGARRALPARRRARRRRRRLDRRHPRRDRALAARSRPLPAARARREPGDVGGVHPRAHDAARPARRAASSRRTTSCSRSTPTVSTTSRCSTSSSRSTIDEGLDAMLARRDLSYHGPYKKLGQLRC